MIRSAPKTRPRSRVDALEQLREPRILRHQPLADREDLGEDGEDNRLIARRGCARLAKSSVWASKRTRPS